MPDGSRYKPKAEVQAIPPELDADIRNWRAWARQRGWLSTCGSVEKFYRPRLVEGTTEENEVDVNRPPPGDWKRAWHVEGVWRTKLPQTARLLIRSYYIVSPVHSNREKWDAYIGRECRKFGMQRPRYMAETYKAVMMLRNQLGS